MTEEQIIDTIEQLDKTIAYYYEVCDTATIERLLKASDKIAVLCYTMATIVAARGTTYLQIYLDRKLFAAGQKLFYMAEGMSGTKADAKTTDTEAFKTISEKELETEMIYEEVKLKLKQGNKVLDGLRQRISRMKKEEELQAMQGSNNNQK